MLFFCVAHHCILVVEKGHIFVLGKYPNDELDDSKK